MKLITLVDYAVKLVLTTFFIGRVGSIIYTSWQVSLAALGFVTLVFGFVYSIGWVVDELHKEKEDG